MINSTHTYANQARTHLPTITDRHTVLHNTVFQTVKKRNKLTVSQADRPADQLTKLAQASCTGQEMYTVWLAG
jgi:hypothetical protein